MPDQSPKPGPSPLDFANLPKVARRLSELEKKKATEKFKEFWTRAYVCPICGSTEWLFADYLVTLTYLEEALAGQPYNYYPMVLVFCSTCGHTLFFNAHRLGLANG